MKIGEELNEYGVHRSIHTCDTCGQRFTVTPCRDDDDGCQAPECGSYDITRDLDLAFGSEAAGGKYLTDETGRVIECMSEDPDQ